MLLPFAFGMTAFAAEIAPVARLQRKPLEKPILGLETNALNFQIRSKESDAEFVITYPAGGREISLPFIPATGIQVVVEAEVDADAFGTFTYRYTISAGSNSVQRVQSLIVEYASAIFDVRTPEGWFGAPLSFRSAVHWADVRTNTFGLGPGKTQSGFMFKASALTGVEDLAKNGEKHSGFFFHAGSLPGLVACYARGHTDLLNFPTEPPVGLMRCLPRLLEDAVLGKTVGPSALPQTCDARELVSRIRSYIKESFAQGWIAEERTFLRFQKQIDEIAVALDADNRTHARSLISRVVADSEIAKQRKELEAEAYALIKYNLQHVDSLL